ncbi:MAG: Hsp70 family protein [Planctomycetes bacterium]|nr:Hsp70 family protein [Planctomycetota bacterium]
MSARNQPPVGIDLGTTFSVVAHLDVSGRPQSIPSSEGDLLTPSVVFFDGASIVVGKEALKAAALEPDRVATYAKRDMGNASYSRPLGGKSVPPEVIQSLILEKLKQVAPADGRGRSSANAKGRLGARLFKGGSAASLYAGARGGGGDTVVVSEDGVSEASCCAASPASNAES